MKIYYVGADVSFKSRTLLFRHFNTEMPRPHSTLIYSRSWFQYKTAKFFPLTIEPPYRLEMLKESLVLLFENYRFFERYIELRNLGASSDFETIKPHITISEKIQWDLSNLPIPKFPITLSSEYYGTWEENKE